MMGKEFGFDRIDPLAGIETKSKWLASLVGLAGWAVWFGWVDLVGLPGMSELLQAH